MLSIDVEDWFQLIGAGLDYQFKKYQGGTENWKNFPSKIIKNTQWILNTLEENNISATFFVLGWVAERYPGLVACIVEAGHELASHGYEHIRVINQSPEEFRADIIKTKNLLEDLAGVEIKGYRAASYSIGEKNLWALMELQNAGYTYSSSVYPVKHDLYGMPKAPRFRFHPNGEDGILEVPITTLQIFSKSASHPHNTLGQKGSSDLTDGKGYRSQTAPAILPPAAALHYKLNKTAH